MGSYAAFKPIVEERIAKFGREMVREFLHRPLKLKSPSQFSPQISSEKHKSQVSGVDTKEKIEFTLGDLNKKIISDTDDSQSREKAFSPNPSRRLGHQEE